MNYPCDTIKDLLPLYHDDVCSDASRQIVDEHLQECAACKTTMNRLNDETYNDHLREERDAVIGHYAKKSRRKSITAGICVASGLAVPVLISFVINLITAQALDWFFIVLTAMMTIALPIALPFIIEKQKWLYAVTSTCASFNLFLWACCKFSGGSWFAVASLSSMLVLTSVFAPLVLHSLHLKKPFSRSKGLITMAIDTVLLYALAAACGRYGNPDTYWKPALLITTLCALFAWLLFGIIRYAKCNGLIKAGLCVISGGLFATLLQFTSIHFYLLFFLAGCIIGGIFLITGIQKNKREANAGGGEAA